MGRAERGLRSCTDEPIPTLIVDIGLALVGSLWRTRATVLSGMDAR